ncbi:MAG: methylated-DNA--[protein]-cysteine S-methyltransferase [Gammaproteobacteria bacterium]
MINARDYQRIETAIDWIRANFRSQPSVAEIAAAVHLSPHHFSRLFGRWAGLSPNQYLRSVTLDAAKQRLPSAPNLFDTALDLGLSGSGRLHDLFVDLESMTPGEYRCGGEGLVITWGIVDSPFGLCMIARTQRGICALEFVERTPAATMPGVGAAVDATPDCLRTRWPRASFERDQALASETVSQVFADSPDRSIRLHVTGSNFQFQVWRALLRVPSGETVSYGSLAQAIDKRGAARAVGQAVGSNPVAWLIPCHRVLRADGGLGGYRWGPRRKAVMLALESSRMVAAG